VHHTEGLMHGFLVLQTLEGQTIADGEETQIARSGRVTVHTIFRFKDGSIQDGTTIFSQQGTFWDSAGNGAITQPVHLADR
jgi:hypothetical protein